MAISLIRERQLTRIPRQLGDSHQSAEEVEKIPDVGVSYYDGKGRRYFKDVDDPENFLGYIFLHPEDEHSEERLVIQRLETGMVFIQYHSANGDQTYPYGSGLHDDALQYLYDTSLYSQRFKQLPRLLEVA